MTLGQAHHQDLDRGPADLPDEIAFLTDFGIDGAILAAAGARARQAGVTADRTLLSEGVLSAQVFYELLARRLEIVYLHAPLPVAAGVSLAEAMTAERVPLAPNLANLRFLMAPQGDALAALLRRTGPRGRLRDPAVAMTSPQRLAALVRRNHHGAIARLASHALPDWNRSLSARTGLSVGQFALGAATAVGLANAAVSAPRATMGAVSAAFSVVFLAMVLIRLLATVRSPAEPVTPAPRCDDGALPVYTVIVPLFREARVVPRLVAALNRIDYPPAKLDIKIVVEANDRDTLTALEAERLPDRFEVMMAPRGVPQTKPRALNVALQFARGRFVVVYDAEDSPEPSQLRTAVACFAGESARLACLQARLAIDNAEDSWLSRLFALEYAALFDVINPGLARLGLPIPLGGTSNHFRVEALRQVNGWDAWNVTEDVDLGIRLARFGYGVAMLPSTTFEEAPHALAPWLGQRRRWQKGWMVTLQTHGRDPDRLLGDLGPTRTLAVFAILFGTVVSALLGPVFVAGVLLDAAFGTLLTPKTGLQALGSALSFALLGLGVASALWPIGLGIKRRGLPGLARSIPLLPAYLLLLSIATWQALFEVVGRPYAWVKTEHGTAKRRRTPF